MRELEKDMDMVVDARMAAAELLLTIGKNPAVKAALLAYGIMQLKEGQKLPVARYGISGM